MIDVNSGYSNEMSKEEAKYRIWLMKEEKKAWDDFYKEQKREQERYFKFISDSYQSAFAEVQKNLQKEIKLKENYAKDVQKEARRERETNLDSFGKGQMYLASSVNVNTDLFDTISPDEIFSARRNVDARIWKDRMDMSFTENSLFGKSLDNMRGVSDYGKDMKDFMNTYGKSSQDQVQFSKSIYELLYQLVQMAKTDMEP